MRGWSRREAERIRGQQVVPAHAGVVRRGGRCRTSRRRGPRACGGGPTRIALESYVDAVVPAHAGVVPAPAGRAGRQHSGPRARGGGPPFRDHRAARRLWSPRTGGWSHQDRAGLGGGDVVPAHAGGGGPWGDVGRGLDVVWSPRTREWSLARRLTGHHARRGPRACGDGPRPSSTADATEHPTPSPTAHQPRRPPSTRPPPVPVTRPHPPSGERGALRQPRSEC